MSYFDDLQKVATLDLPWERLNQKNILVTGATGMICSTLVDILMMHNGVDFHVYASGRNESKVKQLFNRYIDKCSNISFLI